MDWNFVVSSLIGNAIIIAIITAIINHLFNKRLDNYRYSQLQRQKAEIVANLLAKWGKYRGQEHNILTHEELYDYYEELNRMSYQAILWLDTDLLEEIESTFTATSDKDRDIDSLLRHLRQYVLNSSTNTVPKTIAAWPHDNIAAWLYTPGSKSHKSKR